MHPCRWAPPSRPHPGSDILASGVTRIPQSPDESSAPRTRPRSSSGSPSPRASSSSSTTWSRSRGSSRTASTVRIFGLVTQVRARHEGARFDSDVFLIESGVLPAQVSQAAKIVATRFEPEVFVPPLPGQEVRRARGRDREQALFFDGMDESKRLAAGLSRDEEPVYLEPRVPRRDARRARQHQRHLRSRDEDDLRELPSLQPVPFDRSSGPMP